MSFLNYLLSESSKTEYQGKKVKLNKPFRTPDGPKKFSVYVKNDKGNVVKVNFGDPDMEIKRDSDENRKSFRARHNCEDPGPKWKARYWACKTWEKGKTVSDVAEALDESEDVLCEIVEEGTFFNKFRDGSVEMKHGEYQEHLKGKSYSELKYIIKDANEALTANPDNPKAGYYKDEVLYASQELRKRQKVGK